MLRFFRSNQLINAFFVLLYAGLVQLGYFFWSNQEAIHHTGIGPAYDLLLQLWPQLGTNAPLQHLAGLACLISLAFFVNGFVNRWRITHHNTMLPALAVILLGSLFRDFTFFGPIWPALLLVPAILWQLFHIYSEERITLSVFYIGFCLGIAIAFYPPIMGLLPWIIFSLATFRKFVLREYLVILVGVLVPWIWLVVGYFWSDNIALLGSYWHVLSIDWAPITTSFHEVDWLKSGVALFLITGLAFRLIGSLSSSVIQLRKYARIMLAIGPLSLVCLILATPLSLSDFLILLIPGGFILGYSLATLERQMASEAIHVTLLVLILMGQYVSFAVFNWLT